MKTLPGTKGACLKCKYCCVIPTMALCYCKLNKAYNSTGRTIFKNGTVDIERFNTRQEYKNYLYTEKLGETTRKMEKKMQPSWCYFRQKEK